jgi:hypothetical protein
VSYVLIRQGLNCMFNPTLRYLEASRPWLKVGQFCDVNILIGFVMSSHAGV